MVTYHTIFRVKSYSDQSLLYLPRTSIKHFNRYCNLKKKNIILYLRIRINMFLLSLILIFFFFALTNLKLTCKFAIIWITYTNNIFTFVLRGASACINIIRLGYLSFDYEYNNSGSLIKKKCIIICIVETSTRIS